MRKNVRLDVWITSEEKEVIRKRAKESGLSMCEYCRFLILKSKPIIEREE